MTGERAADPMTDPDSVLTVGGPGVAWRETGGQIVVLDLDGSVYFGLNGTGADLWKQLTRGATRAELGARLESSASVTPAQAESDIEHFIIELDRFNLLRRD